MNSARSSIDQAGPIHALIGHSRRPVRPLRLYDRHSAAGDHVLIGSDEPEQLLLQIAAAPLTAAAAAAVAVAAHAAVRLEFGFDQQPRTLVAAVARRRRRRRRQRVRRRRVFVAVATPAVRRQAVGAACHHRKDQSVRSIMKSMKSVQRVKSIK